MDLSKALSFFMCFLIPPPLIQSQQFCSSSRCRKLQNQLGKHTVNGKALFNHVFKSFTNLTETWQCLDACAKDCRCLSYNMRSPPYDGQQTLCELNSAERATDPYSLKTRPGFVYYDMETDIPKEETSNGCCVTSPCLNEGTCHEVHGQKRRLQCNCQAGFAGEFCGTKARSCVDYLKTNRSATPGAYTIQNEHGVAFSVYCDFDTAADFAWTVIMSYTFGNRSQIKGKPFFNDVPISETTPNWNLYRLSKARMLSIQSQSSHWRATCNYPTDGVVLTDYVRALFSQVNPLTHKVHECRRVEYVNIRGSECFWCSIYVIQDGHTHDFNIPSWYGQYKWPGCEFRNAAGAVSFEHSFGFYLYYNTAHRCASTTSSTTQYWFGGSIPK